MSNNKTEKKKRTTFDPKLLIMQTTIMNDDTICALATPHGTGAIAVVRLSGKDSHSIASRIFMQDGQPFVLSKAPLRKACFGTIMDGDQPLDEALVTFFKAPRSFTSEDAVEISIHGSPYIQQRIIEVLIREGARLAQPGEFSRRAFIHSKFDLAQAEAIADLIASQNEAAHHIAMNQLKGGFSKELQELRGRLLDITALMELELDFSEEDVEFADRSQLEALLEATLEQFERLTETFRLGNAIKNGIPVAIVGATNTGKSTLLNALLGEERALVSDIAGTTRDTIEETLNIDGTLFRFIDTAGIRDTEETIERMGIERTFKKLSEADIVIGMFDLTHCEDELVSGLRLLCSKTDLQQQRLLIVLNKRDLCTDTHAISQRFADDIRQIADDDSYPIDIITISAKTTSDVECVRQHIGKMRSLIEGQNNAALVTNLRHYEALCRATASLSKVRMGLEEDTPTDLIAEDLRESLYHLGTITGEITTDEVLGTIFSRFCIGK